MGWKLGLSGVGFLQPRRSITGDGEHFARQSCEEPSKSKKKTFGIMGVHPLLHGWHGSGLTEEQKNERKARQCWAATKRRQNGAAEGLSIFPWGCSAAAGISQLSSSGAQTEAVNFIWSR